MTATGPALNLLFLWLPQHAPLFGNYTYVGYCTGLLNLLCLVTLREWPLTRLYL